MGKRTGRPRGRPPGAKSKATIAKEAAALAALQGLPVDVTALVLMQTIYRDPMMPPNIRLAAAKEALPYESPRLASVEQKHSGSVAVTDEVDRPPRESREEWLERRRQELGVGSTAGPANGGYH